MLILLSWLQISAEPHPGLDFQPFKTLITASSSFTAKLRSSNALSLVGKKQLFPCHGYQQMQSEGQDEAIEGVLSHVSATDSTVGIMAAQVNCLFRAEDVALEIFDGQWFEAVTFATRMHPQQRVQLTASPREAHPCYYGQPRRMLPTRDAAGSTFHTCCGEGLRFSDHTLQTSFTLREDNNGLFSALLAP